MIKKKLIKQEKVVKLSSKAKDIEIKISRIISISKAIVRDSSFIGTEVIGEGIIIPVESDKSEVLFEDFSKKLCYIEDILKNASRILSKVSGELTV